MAGIQETKDVVIFMAHLGNGLGQSLADGEFTLGDIGNFIPALTKLYAAFEGIEDVDDELMDMDETEKEELKQTLINEFDIPQDEVEAFIEEAWGLALDLFQFIKQFFPAQTQQ